ncbi:MAG: phosphotransferase family protein [Gammaproteobacteria bacterium]|nr:phosphotransferase family protein [Gammaproteobacteria bacterium]
MNKEACDREQGVVLLERTLEKFVSAQLGEALRVRELRRLTGGSSHETWSFDVVREKAPSEPLGYVLRREFERSSNTQPLDTEFALLQRLFDRGLPVARPAWCALNEAAFGAPFMIVERVAGVDLRKHLAAKGETVDRPALGIVLVDQQVVIHRVALDDLGDVLPGSCAASALAELRSWTAMIDAAGASNTRPLLSAAVLWLQANAPTLKRLSLVHGDFKANNLMLAEGGHTTILDWEMAHVGDPIEDLAWTLLWTTQDDLVGGLLSRDEYLNAYTAASGIPVDAQRLFYWEMFARVKLAAIFLSGAHPVSRRQPVRPLHALLGRALPVLERDLARMLPRCFGEGGQQ